MNRKIVLAVVVVAASGVVRAWQSQKPVTPVIIGAYVFLLALAVLDMFGGPVANLSGMLAMLAAVYVLLTEFPWQTILGALKAKQPPPAVSTTPQNVQNNGGMA